MRLRQKMILSEIFFNWNEIAAKTEKAILLENFLKNGMKLRLRQKLKFSWKVFLQMERI